MRFLLRLVIENKFKSIGGKFDEAKIAAKFLPEKDGFYIDIGAGSPIEASNSYLFYKRGWRGICVDPIAINEKLHKVFRPRDKFLRSLVGNSLGGSLSSLSLYLLGTQLQIKRLPQSFLKRREYSSLAADLYKQLPWPLLLQLQHQKMRLY